MQDPRCRNRPASISRCGSFAGTRIAQKGFTGPATILEGRFGYFNAFSPDPKIEKLLDGLGETWLLETLNIKAYPCCGTSQGVVGAIQKFKQQNPNFDPSKITAIHMRNSPRLMEARFSDAAPTNEMGAQYSLLFTTAVACYRDLDDPLQYDESVLEDENIKRLAGMITTEELAGAGDHGMSAEIDMTVDGQTHTLTAGDFRGSLANPADLADMESKFRRFSKHVLSTDEQDKVIELVRGLETIADMRELTALLPGSGNGSVA